jgi:heme oxygenase
MPVLQSDLDIMTALKVETADLHKRVESLMPFFNRNLSFERYAATLASFLGFYEPLEHKLTKIRDLQAVGIDLYERQRAHLLRADLRALGLTLQQIAELPRCQDLPRLEDSSDGLGCLYVLEGSTLGGQLIARELSRRFEIDGNSGASFFHSYGFNVGGKWMEFCSVVRRYVDDSGKRRKTLDSASNTFNSFEKWMQRGVLNEQ